MSKSGGKTTPDELDYLFERDVIDEEDYAEFWVGYWKAESSPNLQDKDEYINEWLEVARLRDGGELGGIGQGELPLAGVVTQFKDTAERQAVAIGGYVVRRDKRGRFSKRGRKYQAIKRRSKG